MWIGKLAGAAVRLLNQVSRGVSILAIASLLAMMLLTVSDVFMRKVLTNPIVGSVELTEYLIVVAGFLGVAWCTFKRGHLKVGVIVDRMSPRVQAITDSITLFLGMTVVPLVAWRLFVRAREAHLEGLRSFIMDLPDSVFLIVAGVGYALFFLALLPVLVESIRKAIQK
jgi:TRAP-type C4-dicarboxylate transport system permease small subunit